MTIKDKIGTSLTNFMFPYIQSQFKDRGDMMPKKANEREEFKLKENYLWWLGQEDLLADFYQTRSIVTNLIDVRAEYYYSNANNNIRIVHSGLPNLISSSKARLLMGGGIEYKVLNGEKEDETSTQILQDIYIDNKLDTIILNSVNNESWGKKFAWKISNDPEVSDYPIVELYKPFNYKCIYKRGRLQAIIFINEYIKDKVKYELEEEYGKGYIEYYLYKITDTSRIPCELGELEETAELKSVKLSKKKMLAGEKHLDKGDYDNLISEFDALDETWSQLMDEIRLGRSETYIPDMLTDNKSFNKFRKNFTVLGTDERENGKNEIKHVQPEIRTEQYISAISTITNNCLTSCGLSPFTVGIQDKIGANASGENLTKREMTSLRTRQDMIKSWEEFLEEMFDTLLYAYAVFNKKQYKEQEIQVSFGDYVSPSRSEIIADTKILKDADIIDGEKALDEVYGDELDEEEKLRILANLGNVSFEETPIIEEPIIKE